MSTLNSLLKKAKQETARIPGETIVILTKRGHEPFYTAVGSTVEVCLRNGWRTKFRVKHGEVIA